MTNKQTGGPAFPCKGDEYTKRQYEAAGLIYQAPSGMTLRDYFAAKAMQALLVDAECGPNSVKDFAESAYIMADAMLKAREQ